MTLASTEPKILEITFFFSFDDIVPLKSCFEADLKLHCYTSMVLEENIVESSTVASCAPLCLLLSSTDFCFPPIVATESEWLSWFENRLVWCEGRGEQLKAHTSRSNSGFLSQKLSRALWRELTFPWPGSPAVWTIDVAANIMSSHLYINTETASHPCDSHWASLSAGITENLQVLLILEVFVCVYIQVRINMCVCVCVLMNSMCKSVCIRLHFQTAQYCVCACVGMYVCMCSPWEMKTLTQFNTPVSRCTLAQYSITHTHSHTQTHTPQPDSSGVQLSNITLS